MACGTVFAFRRGSVPEVIDDGTSGFIVDSEEEALAAIRRIGMLDRRSVRAAFERRFTARRMAGDFLRHYQAVAAGPRPRGGQTELKAHQISSRSPIGNPISAQSTRVTSSPLTPGPVTGLPNSVIAGAAQTAGVPVFDTPSAHRV
jgi:hypothetical protein